MYNLFFYFQYILLNKILFYLTIKLLNYYFKIITVGDFDHIIQEINIKIKL